MKLDVVRIRRRLW